MRSVALWDAGGEGALEGFQADHLMAAAAGVDAGRALLRLWSRDEPALSVGRYHRLDAASSGVQRRLSGGSVVPLGPGVLGLTLALPSSAWLAPGDAPLRPDQIPNRALRPVLSVLRELGADAFYPGRDLVTVGGHPLLYVTFCSFADGVLLVEHLLAHDAPFASLEAMAARFDPDGVGGFDRERFRSATALADCVGRVARETLLARLARAVSERFSCDVETSTAMPPDLKAAVCAESSAYAAFLAERGRARAGYACAAEISMLGAVEASARIESGRVRDVEITGDLIAPFRTIEAVQAACEGVQVGSEEIRAAVDGVLLEPGSFVLGANDLGALLVRLA